MDASSSSSSAAAAGASHNNDKEEASNNNSNTASSSTIMIATALLDEFYQRNSGGQQLLADSCKVLAQLIRKAVENSQKFGRIRLNNPRIQSTVAQVPGALDVLAVAGFGRDEEDDNDGDSFLVFAAEQEQQQQTCLALCHNLDTKRSELLAELSKTTMLGQSSINNNNTKNNNNSSPFLSQEERVRRQAAAKQAQKAKRLERQRALSAWKEDEHNRKLKAQRREAALQQVVVVADDNNEAASAMQAARSVDLVPQIRIQKLQQQQQAEQQQHPNDNDTEMADATNVGSAPAAASSASNTGPMIMSDKKDGDMPPSAARLENDNQNEDEDMKEAAAAAASGASGGASASDASVDNEMWQRYLETTPRCAPAPGIRETSVFQGDDEQNAHNRSAAHWKHVLHEWDQMKDSLPSDVGCTIFVRFDEDAPHFGRALVPAALWQNSSSASTPYAGGAFLFDVYLPPTYPQVPPKVQLLTTGGGSVRFGPNLYACGKVCLSLLGTWEGPKWRPKGSTLTQVLVSLQGLILGAPHPYYLEPGHGGWEGRISETQFQATGHTLRGDTVQTEVVPRAVAIYENTVRVGTLRYALWEPAKLLCGDNQELPPYWQPLQRPLHLHLYCNRDRIVREWAGGRGAAQIGTSTAQPHPRLPVMHPPGEEEDDQAHETLLKQIASLAQQVETALANLPEPSSDAKADEGGQPRPVAASALAAAPDNEEDDEDDSDEESDAKPAAKPSPSPRLAKSQVVVDHSPNSVLARLQQLVQAAALSGNHIQAKQWQQQYNVLQDLEQRMQDATAQGNHTTAGLLQQQLKGGVAVVVAGLPQDDEQEQPEDEEMDPDEEMADGFDPDDGFDNQNDDDGFDNDDEVLDGEDDDDDDDGWDSGNQYPYHYWGAGTALKAASPSTAKTAKLQAAKPAIAPYQSQRSSGTVCRLRVRLPNDTSIIEQFDGADTLADLYRHVEQFLHNDEDEDNDNDTKPSSNIAKSARRHQVMGVYGPEMVHESAFARPLSLKGFTLLLARPKKEFSLELHGTRSLGDLGLVPSATLTVMDCNDRGVVKRGDLERRLEEAQGDAMNVDGLTYEGLLELTERVGPSGRGAVDPKQLQAQSTLWSPQDYVGSLKAPATTKNEDNNHDKTTDDGRCPVCLGEFDPMESEPSLRQLNSCGHVFHVACLDTWLETKKACPLCNQAVV